jgi:hypothetical protein
LQFTSVNIEPIILRKKIEELRILRATLRGLGGGESPAVASKPRVVTGRRQPELALAIGPGATNRTKWDGDRLVIISAFWDAALQAKQIGLAG